MHGHNAAIRPIHHPERVAVLLREFRLRGRDDSRGRADADVHHFRQTVRVVSRILRRAFAETLIAAAHDVIRARGPVPRRTPIPLHVAVEAQQLAVRVEADVVSVALTRGKQLRVLPLQIHAQHIAARRLAPRPEPIPILHARQHQIVPVILEGRGGQRILRHIHEVAAHDVELVVRSQHDAVRAVFAIAAAVLVPLPQQLRLAERPLPIRVAQPVEMITLRPLPVHVERTGGIEQTHRAVHMRYGVRLQAGNLPLRIQRHAQHRLLALR